MSALLNGFERGFNMVERHQARKDRNMRLSDLDKQRKQEYQDRQNRLSMLDKRNEERYQAQQSRLSDMDAKNDKLQQERLNLQKQQQASLTEERQWRRNQAEEQKRWGLLAPQLQNIHEQYYETGELPETAQSFFTEHPEYNDYNPSTYRDPEYVKSINLLNERTSEIMKSGKMRELQDPAYIDLFNNAFKSKIQQGVGEQDLIRNATVTGKRVAQLIPTRGGKVSIGLEVSYQGRDGKAWTEVHPMTKGRSAEQDDPVTEWEAKELMAALGMRKHMADMAINGEKYRQRSSNTLSATGKKDKSQAKDKAAYRRERRALEKELRKVQMTDDYRKLGSAERQEIEKPVNEAISRLEAEYGIEAKSVQPKEQQLISLKEGKTTGDVIKAIMDKNKGMNEERAKYLAIMQGYIKHES